MKPAKKTAIWDVSHEELSDNESIVSFNTRSMVRKRADLLNVGELRPGEDGMNLDEDNASLSQDQSPSNLDDQFKDAQQDSDNSGFSTPFKRAYLFMTGSNNKQDGQKRWRLHWTPDTERRWRRQRQEKARKGIDTNVWSILGFLLLGILIITAFLGVVFHEMWLNSKEYGAYPPKSWDSESRSCK